MILLIPGPWGRVGPRASPIVESNSSVIVIIIIIIIIIIVVVTIIVIDFEKHFNKKINDRNVT